MFSDNHKHIFHECYTDSGSGNDINRSALLFAFSDNCQYHVTYVDCDVDDNDDNAD